MRCGEQRCSRASCDPAHNPSQPDQCVQDRERQGTRASHAKTLCAARDAFTGRLNGCKVRPFALRRLACSGRHRTIPDSQGHTDRSLLQICVLWHSQAVDAAEICGEGAEQVRSNVSGQ